MNFLLDTNVVSEPMKPQPNLNVMRWLAQVDESAVFISVVTLAELRYGAERMAAGRRRNLLEEWLQHQLPIRFDGRMLPIDSTVADACGRLVARSESQGRPIGPRDAFIAATAETYGFMLVTRDVSAFQPTLKNIFNPWHLT